jgi:hypothetical protein
MNKVFIALFVWLLQSSNASVGGFVQDASQAFIPGVTVTATNTQTGVVSSVVSNESGTYNIPGLLPGRYKLTAELPGFKTQVFNDVQLGQGASARYNFTLQVGALSDSVEVTAEATRLIAVSSPTIGQVLPEQKVRDLPLVTNNVLDLMATMAGVRGGTGSEATTFAGISAGMVNTVRDGLSVQDGRYLNGVFATTVINPDMVGEFRVILSPVDAEMGRGNGQVQILTRSGTNQFHGSAVWSVRNSALDANTWQNNKQIVNGVWTPGKPTWINRNQDTLSLGGPIVRNKTFFFALWDQQLERERATVRPVVLTDCARNGIFRYWDNWQAGNTLTATNRAGANPIITSVDSFGNPLKPATNPNGTPYTGQLRYFSVFGPLANTPARLDCSDAAVQGNAWDPLRTRMDPVGVSQKYLAAMPHANIFDGGDGLNTAVHQWTRRLHSTGSLAIGAGTNTDTDRKQINIKIDHNFSARHKLAANYSYEWTDGDYLAVQQTWPGGLTSQTIRRPQVLTISFTSTLRPTLLNEARFGQRKNWLVIYTPWESTDSKTREAALAMLLKGGQGFPIAYAPSAVGVGNINMEPNALSCQTNCAQQGNSSPLYDYSDTLSWTKGKHAFRGGTDFRFGNSSGYATPTAPIPKAFGSTALLPGLNPIQAFQNRTTFPNLVANNQTVANSLLYFLSGSVGNAQQVYFLQNPNDLTKWENYLTVPRKIIDTRQNEFSMFFKDDWKVLPSLTLNLGVRYEYYGVPFEGHGLTVVPKGGGLALFGVSGRSFDRWMRPDNPVDMSLLTQVEFVGPRTQNPGKTLYKNDWNNLGPAVGFAWQLPWFGKGKTNVRGGYQITYAGGGRAQPIDNFIFSNPGFQNIAQTQGPTDGTYFDLRNLPSLVPVPPSTLPMQPIPLQKQNQDGAAFDYNYVTPYVQNLTLSVTRDISRTLNVDVRYIGTRGLKLNGNYNLNAPNVFYNPVLFDALERTRKGENVALFDQMFLGLNLNPGVVGCDPSTPAATCAAVNGTTQRGSQHLRLSSTFRNALANGDYVTAANSLKVYNGTGTGAAGTVNGVPGERGTVLRRANKGFNVVAGTAIVGAPVVPAGLFPENWITANPQFANANYYTNSGKSNYNSLQVQGTLRPTQGISFQGTYVWSRALEVSGTSYTNPTEREREYILGSQHVTHDFRSNGTFELPFGPGKLFLKNSTGWVARVAEGWQFSTIFNMNAGRPTSITTTYLNGTTVSPTGLYANSVADVVGSFSAKPFGGVQWNGDYGNYFDANAYTRVNDPQCGAVAVDLKAYCTLQAVADGKTGQILLQNPQPGKRGSLGRQTMELPGLWQLDTAMSKTVRITESKTIQVRFDATNVLNHPIANNPTLNLNGMNAFGFIQDKGDQRRQFRAQARLNF